MIRSPLPGDSREEFLHRYDELVKMMRRLETPPEWRELSSDPRKREEQTMADEEEDDGEDVEEEEIDEEELERQQTACLYCEKYGCKHLLLSHDITFATFEDGEAYGYIDIYERTIVEAFTKVATLDRPFVWENFDVQLIWKAMNELGSEYAAAVYSGDECLPEEEFQLLLYSLLESAGGREAPGQRIVGSGSHCESDYQYFYAEDPKATCEEALRLLKSWLVEKKPVPKKAKKKKKK